MRSFVHHYSRGASRPAECPCIPEVVRWSTRYSSRHVRPCGLMCRDSCPPLIAMPVVARSLYHFHVHCNRVECVSRIPGRLECSKNFFFLTPYCPVLPSLFHKTLAGQRLRPLLLRDCPICRKPEIHFQGHLHFQCLNSITQVP